MKTEQDYQRVYAGINLDAVMHNLEKMHTLIKDDTKIIAVIKTDGYGHGAVPIAKKIESLPYLWGFAVATQQEGTVLRRHGIKKPVLILGHSFEEEFERISEAHFALEELYGKAMDFSRVEELERRICHKIFG